VHRPEPPFSIFNRPQRIIHLQTIRFPKKNKTKNESDIDLQPSTDHLFVSRKKNKTKNESDPQPPAHSFPRKKLIRKTNPKLAS